MLKQDSTENTFFYYLLTEIFNREAVTGVILLLVIWDK